MAFRARRALSTAEGAGSPPVLWHLKVSHYNEKARWALDHKRVPHRRQAAVPGRHRGLARRLTGGDTLPALRIDGETIGDSTRIIARLEQRYPNPPLYPSEPSERRRALELEEFFDEQLGPHVRLLVLHHTLPEATLMLGAFAPDLSGIGLRAARTAFPLIRRAVVKELEITSASVELAFEQLAAAGEYFRAELQPTGYLVGEQFTVADLTLASLLAPAVAPVQFPYPQPQRDHPRLAPVRAAIDPTLRDWTLEMYARHRGRSAELDP